MFCGHKTSFPNHPLHLGLVGPGRKSVSVVLPEQRTGNMSEANAGSFHKNAHMSSQLCSLWAAGRWVSVREGMCQAYLFYEPDDAGTLLLAEGHRARQAVELPWELQRGELIRDMSHGGAGGIAKCLPGAARWVERVQCYTASTTQEH